jgi:hypothetical protein
LAGFEVAIGGRFSSGRRGLAKIGSKRNFIRGVVQHFMTVNAEHDHVAKIDITAPRGIRDLCVMLAWLRKSKASISRVGSVIAKFTPMPKVSVKRCIPVSSRAWQQLCYHVPRFF